MGVPQGSILGPHLFNVYIGDMPALKNCQMSLYADDTACYTSSTSRNLIINRLQEALLKLAEYFRQWKIKINETKTEAIIFSKKRLTPPTRQLCLNNSRIKWSDRVKYLGLHLDNKLNWKFQVEECRRKGFMALSALAPIYRRKSKLSSKNKLIMYKTLIRPLITYGSPVWSSISDTQFRRIQVVQNKCLRIALNAHPRISTMRLHQRSGRISTVKEFCHRQTSLLYKRLKKEKADSLLGKLGNYNIKCLPYTYKHKLPKHIIRDDTSETVSHQNRSEKCNALLSPGVPRVRFRIVEAKRVHRSARSS